MGMLQHSLKSMGNLSFDFKGDWTEPTNVILKHLGVISTYCCHTAVPELEKKLQVDFNFTQCIHFQFFFADIVGCIQLDQVVICLMICCFTAASWYAFNGLIFVYILSPCMLIQFSLKLLHMIFCESKTSSLCEFQHCYLCVKTPAPGWDHGRRLKKWMSHSPGAIQSLVKCLSI